MKLYPASYLPFIRKTLVLWICVH